MALVEIEKLSEAITALTLNRPERLNALTFPLAGELHAALDEVASDGDCKVVILRGAARLLLGLDLRDSAAARARPVVIGAVRGAAFGGGLAIAAACDVRIASTSARFCSAFIRTGLTGTDIGISYLLPQLIGASRAADLIFSGREIDAATAERIGLVSQVVPDEGLDDAVLSYAQTVAGYTHIGLTLTKEVLWHNVESASMRAAIAMENRNQTIAARSPEVRDYMAAYSKRVVS